jgi:hypothetical protein
MGKCIITKYGLYVIQMAVKNMAVKKVVLIKRLIKDVLIKNNALIKRLIKDALIKG